jgi:hypothetical protein
MNATSTTEKGFLKALYLHPAQGFEVFRNARNEVLRMEYLDETILPTAMNFAFGNNEASIKLWAEQGEHGWVFKQSILLSERSVLLLNAYDTIHWNEQKFVAVCQAVNGKCVLLGYPFGMQLQQRKTDAISEVLLSYSGFQPPLQVMPSAFLRTNAEIMNQYLNRNRQTAGMMLESIKSVPLTSFTQ